MFHFCTISTRDYSYKVNALFDSLLQFRQDIVLHNLVVDGTELAGERSGGIYNYGLTDLDKDALGASVIKKYQSNKDKLRWSLKPVFLKFLLKKQEIKKLIYLDNDICFFADFSFLFDYLDKHSFLLTPHNYERRFDVNQNMLEANFRVGLYNAGFVGVNNTAIPELDWWAGCCHYRCDKNPFRGGFDDQKYLDLIPVIREDALVLRHQGCNLAEWNRYVCYRKKSNGEILINGIWPVVFIHFNVSTVRIVLQNEDQELKPFFLKYLELLKKYKPEVDQNYLYKAPPAFERVKYSIWKFFTEMGY